MQVEKMTRPVWAEINLDHLAHNMREVRRLTKPDAMCTAVIKADGYGHGALEIGKTLLENGADRFAVATLSEAIQLRKGFPTTPILVLGYTPNHLLECLVDHQLIQTFYTLEQVIYYDKVCESKHQVGKIHIKLDTGMHRIGMKADEESASEVLVMSKLAHIEIEGLYTHFATADDTDKSYTLRQVEKYNHFLALLKDKGVEIPIHHVSNSAAIIDLPELNYNMVRAGIMLYGLYPSNEVIKANANLLQVMSLRAMISHVKTLEAGAGISYGLTYTTAEKSDIASIPIGYADGFTRMFSGKAMALVKGIKRPVVGRICMDQCMIDVTGLDCRQGDVVTLFGEDSGATITIDDVAAYIGTINYEIVCMIDKRVPRVYMENGQIVKVKDYLSLID